jgi:hypothetical protein
MATRPADLKNAVTCVRGCHVVVVLVTSHLPFTGICARCRAQIAWLSDLNVIDPLFGHRVIRSHAITRQPTQKALKNLGGHADTANAEHGVPSLALWSLIVSDSPVILEAAHLFEAMAKALRSDEIRNHDAVRQFLQEHFMGVYAVSPARYYLGNGGWDNFLDEAAQECEDRAQRLRALSNDDESEQAD